MSLNFMSLASASRPKSVRPVAATLCAALAILIARPGVQTLAAADDKAVCANALGEAAIVMAVLDARTLRLKDGRLIRLGFLDLPPEGDAAPHPAPPLSALIGQSIRFEATSPQPDRYGRLHGWVWREGIAGGAERDAALLQTGMLSLGLARFSPAPAGQITEPCAKHLQNIENIARQAKTGLWGKSDKNPGFAIKNAESLAEIEAVAGRFALVDGRVRSVRTSGNVTYLNFGRYRIRGFAAFVSAKAKTGLESGGQTLKSLEGKRLRLRGWIALPTSAGQGPRMALDQRAQIEVLVETGGQTKQGPDKGEPKPAQD
jgi:endonuclease YncB( thermonuclease family)